MAREKFDLFKETHLFTSPRTNIIELKRLLVDCKSILDVGCGKSSPLRFLNCERLVGVDTYEPDLNQARKLQTHDELMLIEARSIMHHFKPKEFDACVAFDVIEHLTKQEGNILLKDLEVLAKKKVVIFTPNGLLKQENKEEGDYQKHLSGWEPEEMRKIGYNVIGLDGCKSLRTAHHQLKFRPFIFWALVSWLTQYLWCFKHPNSAAAILCWKDMEKR